MAVAKNTIQQIDACLGKVPGLKMSVYGIPDTGYRIPDTE